MGCVRRRASPVGRQSLRRGLLLHSSVTNDSNRSPVLHSVVRSQPSTEAIKSGTIVPDRFSFRFEEVSPLIDAFRRMVRAEAYDVCEMALTTYACARAHGKRFTALPIFLLRAFHHGAIVVSRDSGIKNPKDLEGKFIGLSRGYTVTTAVWVRSILSKEYGVNLDKVTWVVSGDEHVSEYKYPPNVVKLSPGCGLAQELLAGRLSAAIGLTVPHPDIVPLIEDPERQAMKRFCEEGHYPINHTVVVRDRILLEHPNIAVDLFNTFVQAKRVFVDKLKTDALGDAAADDIVYRGVLNSSGLDPLPYGVEPNRLVLDEFMEAIVEQRIVDVKIPIEQLFAASTRGLVG
jgi:hypothetical protein